MMNRTIGFILITVFSLGFLHAQCNPEEANTKFKHHSVYLELGGNSGAYSVNYDYSLSVSESAKLAVGTGLSALSLYSYHDGPAPVQNTQFFITPEANLLFGKNSHHLETGASLILFQIPVLRVGYRYQPRKGGFLFRVGFTPLLFDMDIFPWGGISLGYTF